MSRGQFRSACVALLVAPLLGCATGAARPADTARCAEPDTHFGYDVPVLDMIRVYTGADGVSHAESYPVTGLTSTYLGAVLHQFQLGDPSNVVIVSGPPDFHIPQHPSPYREFFLILAGSSVIELSDGTERPLNPGSMVFMEDVTGPGHSGRFGPCGYVAVDMQFKGAPVSGK